MRRPVSFRLSQTRSRLLARLAPFASTDARRRSTDKATFLSPLYLLRGWIKAYPPASYVPDTLAPVSIPPLRLAGSLAADTAMPRGQGSLFPFQRSGRHGKADDSVASRPPASRAGSETLSKAERMLGEVGLKRPATMQSHLPSESSTPIRTLRKPQSKPSLMHVKVSDSGPQLEWDYAQVCTHDMVEEFGLAFPGGQSSPPELRSKASFSALSPRLTLREDQSSPRSMKTHRIPRHETDSPMNSYFDLSKPLSGHLTHASPMLNEDGGLNRAYTPVSELSSDQKSSVAGSVLSPPLSPSTVSELELNTEKASVARRRPARLDLSKLFPKPKPHHTGNFLTPDRVVRSPARMSSTSEHFPHHLPSPKTPLLYPTGLNSHPIALAPVGQPQKDLTSKKANPIKPKQPPPVVGTSDIRQRNFQQNIFDNAKVHVRRPPKGIQNWFDGYLESESSGGEEELEESISGPPILPPIVPLKTQEADRSRDLVTSPSLSEYLPSSTYKSPKPASSPRNPHLHLQSHSPHVYGEPIRSPDAESVYSSRSRGSKLSNLKTHSVLSVSDSSDDEDSPRASPRLPLVRDSVAAEDMGEDIVIGRAHAYQVKPRSSQVRPMPQARRMSDSVKPHVHEPVIRDFGANGASPGTQSSSPYSTVSNISSTKPRPQWSGHTRQPSVIPEDDIRPHTANPTLVEVSKAHGALTQTSQSQSNDLKPLTRNDSLPSRVDSLSHKLMMVTEEEEALLEMMRRKRAAMAKQSFTEGYKTALHISERRGSQHGLQGLRVVQALEQGSMQFMGSDSKSTTDSFSPSGASTPRRRLSVQSNGSTATSSKSSSAGNRRSKAGRSQEPPPLPSPHHKLDDDTLSTSATPRPDSPPYLPQPERLTYSTFDMIKGIGNEPTSPGSRPTTSPSPLPSPMTPRRGSEDVIVKVACSEPSSTGSVTDTPIGEANNTAIDTERSSNGTKTRAPSGRRRTASSAAEIVMNLDDAIIATHTSTTSNNQSNRSSLANARSINALHEAIEASKRQGHLEKKLTELDTEAGKRRVPDRSTKRASHSTNDSVSSRADTNSVSEDVLAAWGSLGGWRDVERLKATRA